MGEGNARRAAEIYQAAEAPFLKVPWLTRVLRNDYQRLVFNQVAIFYAEGKDEEVIERLEEEAARAPFLGETGEYAFWNGNVLLRQAARSKKPEVMLKNLKDALTIYRKGLEAQPDDWDLKYNYELVQHVLSQGGRGKKKEERVKSILKKMRPLVKPARDKLPPEKRG